MNDDDRDRCAHCGKPLPPNWGMQFCNAICAKAYNAMKKSKQPQKKMSTKVTELGGTIEVERGSGDDSNWSVYVSIFNEREFGDGITKEIAVRNAVAKLPPEIRKHFV